MREYIFNVSAERVSNCPVTEQSTRSAVINCATPHFRKTDGIWRSRSKALSHLPDGTNRRQATGVRRTEQGWPKHSI